MNYAIKVDYLKPLIESIVPQGAVPVLPTKNRSLEELAGQLQGSVLIVEAGPSEEFLVPPEFAKKLSPAPLQVLANLTAGLREYQTYPAADLDSTKLAVIASFFNAPQSSVASFRWGKSMAGKDDPLAGTSFYTLKYQAGDAVLTRVIDVDAQGKIIEVEDK